MDGKLDVLQARVATKLSNARDQVLDPDLKGAIKQVGARRIFIERVLHDLGGIN